MLFVAPMVQGLGVGYRMVEYDGTRSVDVNELNPQVLAFELHRDLLAGEQSVRRVKGALFHPALALGAA